MRFCCWVFRILPVLVIYLSLASSAAAADFIWRINAGGRLHYIMGSIHVAKPELYPLPAVYTDSFARCGTVVVEMDVSKANINTQMDMFVARHGMLPKGQTINSYVEAETLALLQQKGLNYPLLQGVRPWLLALSIQLLKMQNAGYDEKKGLDRYFLLEARKQGMSIVELENIEEQLSAFINIDKKQDDWFLRATLLEYDALVETVDNMFEAWKKGDAAHFDNIFFEEYHKYPELVPILDKMIFHRNEQMAAKIEKMMESEDNSMFIIVGAGHLVGSKGLIEYFKRKGYAVHQL